MEKLVYIGPLDAVELADEHGNVVAEWGEVVEVSDEVAHGIEADGLPYLDADGEETEERTDARNPDYDAGTVGLLEQSEHWAKAGLKGTDEIVAGGREGRYPQPPTPDEDAEGEAEVEAPAPKPRKPRKPRTAKKAASTEGDDA